MEFVKQDRSDAFEARIIENHAGEYAFRDDLDPRPRRNARHEAHTKTERFADTFTKRRSHAIGRRACRQPTRFEQDDLARLRPGLVQEGKRHPSGLAGARRSDENRARMGGKQIANLRQDIVDGEGGVKGAHLG